MRSFLLLLIAFVAVTALPSGILLVYEPDGSLLGLPLAMLESSPFVNSGLMLALLQSSPFANFFFPGLMLALVVGGSCILSLSLIASGNANAYKFSVGTGIILFLWIAGQMMLVQYYQWLQGIYLGIGLLIFLLSYQLLGKTAL
jgi:hypothetical protein